MYPKRPTQWFQPATPSQQLEHHSRGDQWKRRRFTSFTMALGFCHHFNSIREMDHTTLEMLRLTLLLALPILVFGQSSTEKLKKELFAEYDNTIRPAEENDATTVRFDITILNFDLCDYTSVLTVSGWAKLLWEDKKIKWNPSDYGDVKILNLPADELWRPDIVLYNSAESDIDQHAATNSLVWSNGTVLWVPPTKYEARCKLNLRLFPFDRQACTLVIGSWTQHVGQVNLQLETYWNEDLMTENNEWYLLKVDKIRNAKKYACCEEEYADLTYTFTIQRRPETYKTLIMTPAFVVVILTLATFILPTHAGEKIVLNSATALIICIVLFAISTKLPAIAYTPPLIVLFFGSSLLMVAIAFVESVWVIKISRNYGAHPLPPFIKQALSSWLGSLLFNGRQNVPPYFALCDRGSQMVDLQVAVKKDEEGQGPSEKGPGEFHREWLMFASAFDRVFFVTYAVIFTIKIASFYIAVSP